MTITGAHPIEYHSLVAKNWMVLYGIRVAAIYLRNAGVSVEAAAWILLKV